MRKIFKYKLESEMSLPLDAEIIRVGQQEGINFIWVLFDDDVDHKVDRRFKVVGTGQTIPYEFNYVYTWVDGHFVWHLFELMQS